MKKFFKVHKWSSKSKLTFVTVIGTLIVGIILTSISYFTDMNFLMNEVAMDSTKTVQAWSKDVSTQDVETLMQTKDINSPISKKLIAHFDRLAKYQPQVAQGYIFGTELKNGTGTSVVSGPTFLMEDFKKSHLNIGDIYTQPANIAKAIQTMKYTKQLTVSNVYSDSFGTWITVLKPFMNNQGNIFAYYGVDFNAKPYIDGKNHEIITIIWLLLGLVAIITVIQYFLVNKGFRSIEEMKQGIAKVSAGDYTVKLKESSDEFGQLAVKFNGMVETVGGLLDSVKSASNETTHYSNSLYQSVENQDKRLKG